MAYAIGYSVFTSVSAFNNAGFDVFKFNSSLTFFQTDIFFNIVIAFLIVCGGLGYLVIMDIIKRKFNFHFNN